MTHSELTQFPVYNLDTDSAKHAFSKVGIAIDERDYRRAIEFASTTLVKIQESLVMTVLEHRAYALGMEGKFDLAVKDAQDMISYKPTSAVGYLRLGDLYRIQGKQLCAIDTYTKGLQSVSENNPNYPQLVEDNELATKQSNSRVDFIAKLPIEIVDDIVALLPDGSKSTSLGVSSIWRNKIFECSNTWKTLTTGDGADNHLTSIITHIASHVEDLTINTTDRQVFFRYLIGINAGSFSKIRSLNLGANITKYIDTEVVMPVSSIFWRIGGTLTSLILHLNQHMAMVTLAALLSSCSNLTTLEYSTLSNLSRMIGEVALLNPHNALVDMDVKAKYITGQDVQKILPHCPKVRRLLLNGCTVTVLDVVDTACQSLVTFGYNAQNDTIPRLDVSDTARSVPGICHLYTSDGRKVIAASRILPLIHRNMHSLETLHINITAGASESHLKRAYADLKLENLKSLTFWGCGNGIVESLILRSIRSCTKLTHLGAISLKDIRGLTGTLVTLPQLEFFNMTNCKDIVGETGLIHLFDKYTRNSQSKRRLRAVWLRGSISILSDNVLDVLADITTLEEIWFCRLQSVTTDGVESFF
ncbi:hypothetical protein BJV82DRAFT_587086, partial [Fennellomyces sp. T-0311]